MEDGTKGKKTVFVGGIGDDVDESVLYQTFSAFGDVVEVQLPQAATNTTSESEAKHRGFAFITFSSPVDAQDAIDNMDLNELRGRVIKVNVARPMKAVIDPGAGNRAIWESEEWLQQHAKPLAQSGGKSVGLVLDFDSSTQRLGVQGRNAQRGVTDAGDAEDPGSGADEAEDENAMQV
ncbi:RNA-binding domain-containing protein [Chiua virens]|nr:RNA-binding domain-containing protein [Chiua virens]